MKLVQPTTHGISPFGQKVLVAIDDEQRGVGWNALGFEGGQSRLLDQRREVLHGGLVADLPVGLSADESEVCNVVGIARCVRALQNRLGKDMVKLQAVAGAGVIEGDKSANPWRPLRGKRET